MTYYAVAITVTLILCYCCTTVYPMQCGVEARGFRNAKIAFLVLLPLTLVAVFRWDVGIDTIYGYNYWESYQYARNWENPREFEPLFLLLTGIISRLELPYWWYLTICSIIFMGCVSYGISIGSIWTKWSILVFVLLFVLFDSFNILRQSLAVGVSLIAWGKMGYDPPSKKKDVQILLLFVAGGLLHTTAFLNIPIYIVSRIRFNRAGLMKFAVLALLLTPIMQIVLRAVMIWVTNGRYTFEGFARINAIMTGVFFLLCWYFYDGICALDENAYMYVNYSLCIFVLIMNSGALMMPFRVFDMLKIGYMFIIPYLLKGIPRARTRFWVEIFVFLVLGAWFYNNFFLQDRVYSDYHTIFENFSEIINLP